MIISEAPVIEVAEKPDFLDSAGNEVFKSLCFNCDLRQDCKWKAHRKMHCEHFL